MENLFFEQGVDRFYAKNTFREKSKLNHGILPNQDSSKDLKKRIFDLTFSIIALVLVFSWLFPIVAIFIKMSSSGPVLFKQLRHGKGNKVFYCYKFRTMIENEEADTKQAVYNDKRITKIGRFLRMSSLDELPQLINVIKGEMSIVGPRPHAVPMNLEFAKEIENYMIRHSVKPGITGLAQAKGFRGEIKYFYDIHSRFKLDMFYIKNWCLLFDLLIILKTAYSLLFKKQNVY